MIGLDLASALPELIKIIGLALLGLFFVRSGARNEQRKAERRGRIQEREMRNVHARYERGRDAVADRLRDGDY